VGKMKVYEIGLVDCKINALEDWNIWIATDCKIENQLANDNLYLKEIEVNPDNAGIDLVIKKEEATDYDLIDNIRKNHGWGGK